MNEKNIPFSVQVKNIHVDNDTATIAHEASAGKIDEVLLFYMMSRGIEEEKAMAMVVNGFFSDVVNVGGGKPHSMSELIDCINLVTGSKIAVILQDSAKSDVKETVADHKLQAELTGFIPQVSLHDGIEKAYKWASKPENQFKLEKWIG